MSSKPVVRRARGDRDLLEAGDTVTQRFVDAVEREDHIDAWRLLQDRRDVPEWLRDDSAEGHWGS